MDLIVIVMYLLLLEDVGNRGHSQFYVSDTRYLQVNEVTDKILTSLIPSVLIRVNTIWI